MKVIVVKFFFWERYMIKPFNHTFVTLIPKKEKPKAIKNFHPISLCDVVYKIIMKILSNRLRIILDKVVYPYECAFILGSSITYSVIACRELIYYIKKKKMKIQLMAVRIDLTKTYDKVE